MPGCGVLAKGAWAKADVAVFVALIPATIDENIGSRAPDCNGVITWGADSARKLSVVTRCLFLGGSASTGSAGTGSAGIRAARTGAAGTDSTLAVKEPWPHLLCALSTFELQAQQ